jgi:hypothetical protein
MLIRQALVTGRKNPNFVSKTLNVVMLDVNHEVIPVLVNFRSMYSV